MTNNACTVCGRSAPTSFLCAQCVTELKNLLQGLAQGQELPSGAHSLPWLEALEDVRLGRTRLGESARRSTENNTPLMVRLGPAANPTRETQWANSPVDVLKRFHGVMATWIRHLTESRGVVFIPVRSVANDHTGPIPDGWRRLPRDYRASSIDCAEWLAHHVAAIAQDEAAGELFGDVKRVVDDIERMVNRPRPPLALGPCPTVVDSHGKRCAVRLSAPHTDAEVQCPSCGQTHNAGELFADTLRNSAYQLIPRELLGTALVASNLPTDERRLREWRSTGLLQPSGYDGNMPLYRLGDAQKLAEEAAEKRRKRKSA